MSNASFVDKSSKIAELVSGIRLNPDDYVGQVIDEDLVEWYNTRFDMFVADGVRSCITAYMRKAQLENTNQLTKLVILHLGLNK